MLISSHTVILVYSRGPLSVFILGIPFGPVDGGVVGVHGRHWGCRNGCAGDGRRLLAGRTAGRRKVLPGRRATAGAGLTDGLFTRPPG